MLRNKVIIIKNYIHPYPCLMANNTVIMMVSKNGAVVIAHVRSHHSCGQPRFNSQKPHHMWVVFVVWFSPLFWQALLWVLQLKPSPQKAGVCGRAINTTNSEGPGLKPRPSSCIFRQLISLHFTPLCLSSPRCINGYWRPIAGGHRAMD